MGKRKVLRSGIVLAAIFAVAVSAGSGSVMAASKNCSHLGTFLGHDLGSPATWMDTATPGQSATVGQMVVEWVSWDPGLGVGFPAVRTTNPMGVWQKVNEKTVQFMWIAYGLDADGLAVYVVRASGVSTMVDCDHKNFTYVMELFGPWQNISTDLPYFGSSCGTGIETRMQLVQATCPQ